MTAAAPAAVDVLNRRYLIDFPREAARTIEGLPVDDSVALLADQPPRLVIPIWKPWPPAFPTP